MRQTRLLTIGTFDPPHLGHANLFKKCDVFADQVIVGVNSDEFVMKYRKVAPLYHLSERQRLIESLGYETVPNHSAGRELIQKIMPDMLAIGSDWLHKDYMAQIDMTPHDFDAMRITLIYIPYTEGISASDLKERISRSVRGSK